MEKERRRYPGEEGSLGREVDFRLDPDRDVDLLSLRCFKSPICDLAAVHNPFWGIDGGYLSGLTCRDHRVE